eukprot:2104064-Lingulodinium_polyedra.AAC.1
MHHPPPARVPPGGTFGPCQSAAVWVNRAQRAACADRLPQRGACALRPPRPRAAYALIRAARGRPGQTGPRGRAL